MTGGLPAGWAWTTLGGIAEVKGGITKGQKRREGDVLREVPYLRVANVQRGYLDLRDVRSIEATEDEIGALSLQSGDILFNEGGDRDKLGRGWVWRGEIPECIHQNHVFRARPRSSEIESRFVSWYANSEGQQYFINEGKQTTNLASINLTKLSAFPVLLAPADEQRRIVEAIEAQFTRLDAAVEGLKRVQRELKRYRAAVLKAACEGRLVPTEAELARAEGRDYEPAEPQRELPEGWTWATVGQLAQVETGATPLRTRHDYYVGGTVPWVTSGAVNRPFVDEPTQYITDLAIRETNAKVLPAGTLIVAMYGEGKTRGKVSELRIDAATNQACAGLVFKGSASVTKQYVKLFFESNYLKLRALAAGGAQPNLNLSIIKQTVVPLPPETEQRRIVAEVERRLSVVEKAEAAVEANLKRAARMRQAILRKAFEGKLVPQDPNDEPASVLLERIRAERAGAAVNGRGRRARKGSGQLGLPL